MPALAFTVIALLVGTTCLVLGLLPAAETRLAWLLGGGFYLLGLAFLGLIGSLLLARWRDYRWARRPWSEHSVTVFALVVACALVGAFAALSTPQVRVLADEANLLGTSLNLHEVARPTNALKGQFARSGEFFPIAEKLDKRPLGFPMLLAAGHAIFGYSAGNALWLNLLLSVLALCVFAAILREWLPPPSALAGLLLLGSFPALALSATSGGMEMANLTFMLTAFLYALRAIRRVDPLLAFASFCAAALAAQMRYETVLFSAALSLCLIWQLGRGMPRLPLYWLLVPLFYLPLLWQQAGGFAHEVALAGATSYFSVENLTLNGAAALKFFLGSSPVLGASPLVAALALAGVSACFFALRRKESRDATAWVAGFAWLAMLVLVLSYWSGNFLDASVTRLAVAFLPAIAAFATLFLVACGKRLRLAEYSITLFAGLLLVANYVWAGPQAWQRPLPATRAYHDALRLLEEHYPGQHVLVLSSWSGWFVVQGYSAIARSDYEANRERMVQELARGSFDRLVAIEALAPGSEAQTPATDSAAILSGFEPLSYRQYSADLALRISSADCKLLACRADQ